MARVGDRVRGADYGSCSQIDQFDNCQVMMGIHPIILPQSTLTNSGSYSSNRARYSGLGADGGGSARPLLT